MREMVGDQAVNQAAKSLTKVIKRKKNHQLCNSKIAVLVVLMLLL
jgi:hypothetical protein